MSSYFSSAADRNKQPICQILKSYLKNQNTVVLEIGSGTGQHALFFCSHFNQLIWNTSDVVSQEKIIQANIKHHPRDNIRGPLLLEIGKDDFPKFTIDMIYTANTLHIMTWDQCVILFEMLGKNLATGAYVFIYGPMKYNGEFTSKSNKQFDQSLKDKKSSMGIRDFTDIEFNMTNQGFRLIRDHKMPANNQLLVYEKQ